MLSLTIGPMYSGKTTRLLQQCEKYLHQEIPVLIVKHADDTRYTADKVSTHQKKLGHHLTADAIAATHLIDIINELERHQIIAIDEGQFFPDLYEMVLRLLRANKTVLIAALDGNSAQRPFAGEQIQRLLPYAERVKKLTSVCQECKVPNAVVSIRITDDTAEKVVGGADKYHASCLRCLFDKT